EALLKLLISIQQQTLLPNQIIIVDGSLDNQTKNLLSKQHFENLEYYLVQKKDRGLTRQRNFGLAKVQESSDVICFLDDDTVLDPDYFRNLLATYTEFPAAVGVGGYINALDWEKIEYPAVPSFDDYEYEGWRRKLGSRNVLRKK